MTNSANAYLRTGSNPVLTTCVVPLRKELVPYTTKEKMECVAK